MLSARRRYLDKRTLTGPWQITGVKRDDYAAAVIIPACDEERWLFLTLDSLAKNCPQQRQETLVLVVVNHPADAARSIRIANRRTLELFTASPLRQGLQLGWIDACSDGFELAEGGVGSARKIGFDLALSRLGTDIDPLLISLDADTLVEPNYLEEISRHFASSRAGGCVLPFRHQAAKNENMQRAIEHYELYLYCYVIGLKLAGSPYAYHTIGSALACRTSAYIRCGGMNRRRGGEDFYFLQSLAKTSGVDNLAGTTVHPAGRLSNRVPFGTGPAIAGLLDNPETKLFYPLAAFSLLGRWLDLARQSPLLSGSELQSAASRIDRRLGHFLHRLKLSEKWDRLRNNHRPEDMNRSFDIWFDALRSQQLLRFLCDHGFCERQTAAAAIPEFFKVIGLKSSGDLKTDLEQLRHLRNCP
ncbi:MAG: hypothetical protein C0623_12795 [Desulfuromonas sp.]|nr:MAG: hypothetical protein C0623_12795 [Desulfuromonas sp.]